MGNAIFITGFSNWGKTTIINKLFGGRMKFYQEKEYIIDGLNSGTKFTVDSHSNDDYNGNLWLNKIGNRLNKSPSGGENLLTALCPSTEVNNNFVTLLNDNIFDNYDRLYVLLIKNKYDHHAQLNINNIIEFGKFIKNVEFIEINIIGDGRINSSDLICDEIIEKLNSKNI